MSETLFRKRRDLQQMQTNFDAASRELMDVRAEKNDLERRVRETAEMLQGVEQDVT